MERLNNPWNRGFNGAKRRARRARCSAGRRSSLSPAIPRAAARGETADHLLVVDELQDQDPLHLEAVFTPDARRAQRHGRLPGHGALAT